VLCNVSTELSLGYRDREEDISHFQEVARISDFSAGPRSAGWIETTPKRDYLIHETKLVVRRYATDAEIAAVFRLWGDKQVTLTDWLDEVLGMTGLLETEKARLQRLFREYLASPHGS
jgi:hypothetical protein